MTQFNEYTGTDGSAAQHEGPYIDCRDLFKIYKRADLEVVALRGLDLRVEPGELIAVIGASGSGKSTLLNILAGLDRPSAGEVLVGSRDLLDVSDSDLVMYRRSEVGFVWQATARNLVPYLSVGDNIELPMALSGQPAKTRHAWSEELLESLGMADKRKRLPYQLSGGEQQRAAIAVGLANKPPLLLADEPTGELDTENADSIFQMIRGLNRSYGVTVVVVTHYAGVSQFVDRVVHIRDGRIGSETFSRPDYRRDGDTVEEEYVVVDPAGRLQLPHDMAERFIRGGLAKIEFEDGQITIDAPSTNPRQPKRGS
jgi:ABC-type lipoprotein export system ATPase subunit